MLEVNEVCLVVSYIIKVEVSIIEQYQQPHVLGLTHHCQCQNQQPIVLDLPVTAQDVTIFLLHIVNVWINKGMF